MTICLIIKIVAMQQTTTCHHFDVFNYIFYTIFHYKLLVSAKFSGQPDCLFPSLCHTAADTNGFGAVSDFSTFPITTALYPP